MQAYCVVKKYRPGKCQIYIPGEPICGNASNERFMINKWQVCSMHFEKLKNNKYAKVVPINYTQ